MEEKEKDISAKEKLWEQQKPLLQREHKLRMEKRLFKEEQQLKRKKLEIKFKKPNTSKFLISFLFINCTIIEIFSCFILYVAVKSYAASGSVIDFSPLTALIGAVVTEVIGYAIYTIKATKENTKGGITYETAMRQGGITDDESKKSND